MFYRGFCFFPLLPVCYLGWTSPIPRSVGESHLESGGTKGWLGAGPDVHFCYTNSDGNLWLLFFRLGMEWVLILVKSCTPDLFAFS